MSDAQVREKLARIAAGPPTEWAKRIEQEFPGDAVMSTQMLLWLHADKEGVELEAAPPSLGEAADERYELSIRIDGGATAAVWRAYDRRLGRNVAIKVFHEHDESEVLAQVLAEARAASDVISDHVVRVLDVQYGDSRPYIVMELVGEHEPDKDEIVLGAAASASRPRSVAEVARWVMHVARGIHDAHQRNVFHRDLKPKNVLITPNSRRARVADFGLAVSGASPDVAHPAITLLKRGPSGPVSVRGTPEYMAPEQARGLPLTLDAGDSEDRAVLVAIDVWGIGATAYDLLTGRPPWLARPADDLSAWEIAASTERPPPLERTHAGERIPRRLRRVVEKAMAVDPKARYATAAAVAHELQAFLARRPTGLDRSRLLRIALWCWRNPQLAVTVLVALGLTGLAAMTHATVTQLREQRNVLDRQVEERTAEQVRLSRSVDHTRGELDETRKKLLVERQSLATLGRALAEERITYQAVLDATEQSLREANTATRQIINQLERARRDKRTAEQARAALEKTVLDLRRSAERAARERDRIRGEREAAHAERDVVQRERDAALAEREALEKRLRTAQDELARVGAAVRLRAPRP